MHPHKCVCMSLYLPVRMYKRIYTLFSAHVCLPVRMYKCIYTPSSAYTNCMYVCIYIFSYACTNAYILPSAYTSYPLTHKNFPYIKNYLIKKW